MKCNEKGLTLMEIIISIGLIGLVSTIGLSIYLQANKSFEMAEDRWILQTEMRQAATVINKNLRNSYKAVIRPSSFLPDIDMEDDDNYIYVKDDNNNGYGKIMFKSKDEERVIIGNEDENEYSISFNLAENEGEELTDTITYKITAKDTDYEVESALYLANMEKQNKIKNNAELENNIKGIYFKNKLTQSGSPSPEISTFCFIATASYGSKNKWSVKVLRMFRDKYLINNKIGRQFVELYYDLSPPVAKKIANNSFLKLITRILLLPFVLIALLFIINNVSFLIMLILIVLYVCYRFNYFKKLVV